MRVAVFCFSDSFLEPCLKALFNLGCDMKVHVSDWRTGLNWPNMTTGELSVSYVKNILEWCDMAFFEFARDPLPLATKYKHDGVVDCSIVVRFIDHELWRPDAMVYTLWDEVDGIIFLNETIRNKFHDKLRGKLEFRINEIILPPGVDTDRFKPPKDLLLKPFRKTLCMVGYIHHRKRIFTMVESLYELLNRDKGWELHIRGNILDYSYWEWIEDLTNTLGVDIWLHKFGTMEQWWELAPVWFWDKSIIISNSMEEGFHATVAEGASCGVLPMIFNWRGADLIWPREWIFKTQNELVEKILDWWKLSRDDKVRLAREAREYVSERYSYKKIVPILEGFFSKFL